MASALANAAKTKHQTSEFRNKEPPKSFKLNHQNITKSEQGKYQGNHQVSQINLQSRG